MFCASIRAVWDFSVNLFRSISSWSALRDVRRRGNRHFQRRHGFFGARHFPANKLIESRAVNGFVPEQLGGDLLVLIAVQVQNLLRLEIAAVEEPLYFLVNLARGLLGAVALKLEREERGLALGAIGQANPFAHAIEGDHLAG